VHDGRVAVVQVAHALRDVVGELEPAVRPRALLLVVPEEVLQVPIDRELQHDGEVRRLPRRPQDLANVRVVELREEDDLGKVGGGVLRHGK
jgi:hypothetical protein